MPHIRYRAEKKLSIPSLIDEVEFLFIAKSDRQSKIGINYKDKEFLLTLKKDKKGNYLIKGDKITRISPVSYLKKAINSYIDLIDGDIIFTNTSENHKKIKPQNKYLKDIGYFINNFEVEKDIWIEIGFGSGRHLLYQAENNRDIQFIGLEIHTPSIEQVLKQIRLLNLTNILLINYDARLFMEFLKSNLVKKIFIHFPVPWDKKPHRRIYSAEFINEAIRVLDLNSMIELRSDSKNYIEYCLNLLTDLNNAHIEIDINKELKISSKYEDRWRKQQKNIYDICLVNQTLSDKRVINRTFDFNFDIDIDITKLKSNILVETIIKDSFFLNFEDVYLIDNDSLLIELTFGDFNKPISKFILITNRKARYYQGTPVPTSANYNAHLLICEMLNDNRC